VLISEQNPHFTAPLERHVSELADAVSTETRFVLLGSIASKKYVIPLLEVLGPQLFYPAEFTGLGDMSRGALLFRCARAGEELAYAPASSISFRKTSASFASRSDR